MPGRGLIARAEYRSCILHIDSAFCLSRNGKINASLLADDDKKIAMMDVEGITVYRTHSSNQFVWFESWWGQYYCFAPEKVRSIVISMYVSLFVCLSVCLSAGISRKPHELHQFYVPVDVAAARSFTRGVTLYYVYFRLLDNVMFSNSWLYGAPCVC